MRCNKQTYMPMRSKAKLSIWIAEYPVAIQKAITDGCGPAIRVRLIIGRGV